MEVTGERQRTRPAAKPIVPAEPSQDGSYRRKKPSTTLSRATWNIEKTFRRIFLHDTKSQKPTAEATKTAEDASKVTGGLIKSCETRRAQARSKTRHTMKRGKQPVKDVVVAGGDAFKPLSGLKTSPEVLPVRRVLAEAPAPPIRLARREAAGFRQKSERHKEVARRKPLLRAVQGYRARFNDELMSEFDSEGSDQSDEASPDRGGNDQLVEDILGFVKGKDGGRGQ